VSEVNLKEQINLLIKLQSVDAKIYCLRQEKKGIPQKIREFEEAFEKEKERLTQMQKQSLDLQKQRKEKELDLAAKDEEARKMQTQLYQIKTNREYTAKLKEIEAVKADASVFEDDILVLLEEADKLKDEINKEKQSLAEAEKNNNLEKEKLESRSKEIDDNLSQIEAQRSQITQQIDAKILTKYDKILVNRDYLAIVKVENNACQGCYMNVPPQVINLIKMYDNLVICEVCQRILYIEEEGVGDIY
jgi:hypothetical protein